MALAVTVQIDGADVLVGTLFSHVRNGVETASFSYDASYLADLRAFPLAPDMPLVAGAIHSNGQPMFHVFEDCLPDRWGRNLIMRAERISAREENRTARSFFEYDLLQGVNDVTRQGALRFWENGQPLASADTGVPREVDVASLLASADKAAKDMDADVRDLLAAGSSLGGARPKASILDEHNVLNIAKFPKVDESVFDDTCAWESVALELARRCGMNVPATRLLRIAGRAVLLLERFDRQGEKRIPYLSGMTAVQGEDGKRYSYLELVDFLETEGASPEQDIRELWLRILFSCAIGNTDDHMRNHGFLRMGSGWRLSPLFDVNPTLGSQAKYLSSAIDFDRLDAEPRIALECCEYYRLTSKEARTKAGEMARVLKDWRRIALRQGINNASIEAMSDCFEAGIARLESII